jgi:hypothetical protein
LSLAAKQMVGAHWAFGFGGFFQNSRVERRTAEKGAGDGAFTQGGAGTSASKGHHSIPGQQSESTNSRLSYRKLKLYSLEETV